jgi:flagellar M-ring protein FliF
MGQIQRLLQSLSLKQKISLVVVAAAVISGLVYFTRWSAERDFTPLFTNLSAEDAGAVVTKLKESGVEYRLSADGGTIKVPSAKVADLRLQMASAGLPKTGRIGFELFDQTNFGATEFAEKVNYHRALEGELERSVISLSEVESARVHITLAKESVFLDQRQPAKASVLVKLRAGHQLAPASVQSITHLVASAVEGLSPDRVSVLDVHGRLLSRARKSETSEEAEAGEGALEYRRNVERDLLAKINSTLDPLLGPDKFRASVSVECDFTSGEQSEETFDPTKSVMATSQRTEDLAGGSLPGGVPGTASNLPRPVDRVASGNQGVARRTENISYQTSRIVRRLRLPQGTVKRMSVAVLLDHAVRFEGKGDKVKRVVEPPSAERLKATRDLVSGAIGLQADRGDQLIVESLPFESTLSWEPPPSGPQRAPTHGPGVPSWLTPWLEGKNLIYVGAGAGVAVLLVGGGVFLMLRRRKKNAVTKRVVVYDDGPPELEAGSEGEGGDSLQDKAQRQLASQLAARKKEEEEILRALRLPGNATKKGEVLAKHLADEQKKSPNIIAQVVRTWMNDTD